MLIFAIPWGAAPAPQTPRESQYEILGNGQVWCLEQEPATRPQTLHPAKNPSQRKSKITSDNNKTAPSPDPEMLAFPSKGGARAASRMSE